MKVLINMPDYRDPSFGGVASFYYGMIGYWNEEIKYNIVGRRKGVSGMIWLPWDIVKFLIKLLIWRPDAILVNPSLFCNALMRDFVFLNIAFLFKIPIVVLFHGFNLGVANTINNRWVSRNLNRSSLIMVLAGQFRDILKGWHVLPPIKLITTKVEDRMLDGFNINCRVGKVQNILFLSRVIKEKGIYEIVDTFIILKRKYPYLNLRIVGGGGELGKLKQYVINKGASDIVFTGPLAGEDRLEEYRKADLFFFPSYSEGMPTVVLEAMAFGLPVITRKVGGLVDFFEDEKMGRITDSLEPICFSEMIETYLENKDLCVRTSRYNHEYALKHFMATIVGRKIELLIKNSLCIQ